jgi:glycyl-tRNA synthetase beta chain
MTGELLLELLTEEIPARMQRRAIEDLTVLLRDKLADADIPAASTTGYVTPRRLTVIADGIPLRQSDREEERRGPRVGAPQQAIDGFLRGVGLASIDQCEVRATDRGEFYFAVLKQPGRTTSEVLPELILAATTALPWPKSMRYPASNLRWVRPLNSVVCLFDGAVLNLPLGAVPVGRVTRGHRFLSPGEISVVSAADYRAKLANAHVVLGRDERRDIIAKGLDELAKAEGLRVKPDEGLLDEVTGLVECPIVLMGSIDADFVRPLPEGLPPEVLATAMRTHQKYFTCLNQDGTPAPRFLFVANNLTTDNGKTIAAGNERVLRARLSDARFFWDQDRKVPLEDRVEALKQRVYHEKLGSVFDKALRVENIAHRLAPQVGADPVLSVRAARAAHLAKADLSTAMVGEFPELQGVMGRYYALADGDDPRVAEAIAEHYKPLGPNDTVPTAPESIALALADKIDTLVCFFAIGEKPSGSGDPYALRRAAIGIIRIILKNNLRLQLRPFFDEAWQNSGVWRGDSSGELLEFIAERLKVHLRGEGIRHDLITAAFAQVGSFEDDLVRLLARVRALERFLSWDDGANLLVAYRRAANIVSIEERKDQKRYDSRVDQSALIDPLEQKLNSDLDTLSALPKTTFLEGQTPEDFSRAMSLLAGLRRPVDEFFEHVTVNVDDPKLRENRLRLLARIRATMNQVADFSQIEG